MKNEKRMEGGAQRSGASPAVFYRTKALVLPLKTVGL